MFQKERQKSRSEVVRHMCTTTNRITDKLGKVDWNAVKKEAIGITAVTVSGLVKLLQQAVWLQEQFWQHYRQWVA